MKKKDAINLVIKGAEKCKLSNSDLIELYKDLRILIHENEEKYNYECNGSGIGVNAIDFSIIVKRDEPIPEALTKLFYFKIDTKYKVSCSKSPRIPEIDKETKDRYTFKVTFYR